MKISYNWLKQHIDLEVEINQLSDILIDIGLEVEAIEEVEKYKGGLEGLVIGEVLECNTHPNADKLKITKVDVGDSNHLLQIVCGANNVATGQKVVVAVDNTTIHPLESEPFKIKKTKIRGENSEGMICAEDEIGFGENHDGIMVLNTSLPNGTPLNHLFKNEKDTILEIAITPNRGDAVSHYGVARDLKAFFNSSLKQKQHKPFPNISNTPISVKNENQNACIRYSGITIKNVIIAPSPNWLQWKLKAIGQKPINNLVDITNYILHDFGQPLHAFDTDKITGNQIIIKTLPKNTPFTSLDKKERKLQENDLMICDGNSKGMCIAGVFGGLDSGVTENTKTVFLESACFSPEYIRKTSNFHNLKTDASYRFERSTDPNLTVLALQCAAEMIVDICKGEICSSLIDIYPKKIVPQEILCNYNNINRLIGENIPKNTINQILNSLEIEVIEKNNDDFIAKVPTYRTEVLREADIIEEILRIYGFNKIQLEETFSTSYIASFEAISPYKIQENLSNYLAGKGFREIITNSLTHSKIENDCKLNDFENISILNFSSEELDILKPTPIYTAIDCVKRNFNRKKYNLKFFEFGKYYLKSNNKFVEKEFLSLYTTGKLFEESWLSQDVELEFQNMSGIVFDILKKNGIQNFETNSLQKNNLFSLGLEISIAQQCVAKVGILNKKILDYFSISQNIFYSEIFWDIFIQNAKTNVTFRKFSNYPEVRRDLSLVIDKKINYKEIENTVHNLKSKYIKKMNLFSVYEGEQLGGKDKKSYAIAFYLQSDENTLKEAEIDKEMNNLINTLETKLNSTIRK